MDQKTETTLALGNPLMRYAVLFIGIIILLISQSALTWKRAAERDAAGDIDAIQFEIKDIERVIADSDDATEKKELREEIKVLKEEKLVDARFEAEAERVDAKSGIWLISMMRFTGLSLVSLGLLVIAAKGCSHEKLGALVALGFILTQI
ncbi:hypothetical protein HW115_08255 [Verrucomicrobiaceae bacterium N1E253]|uniref:Uncharacterized protein n=1 Tax=Oceaniferula marina TaxID=2748318 RepID=A0A851GIA2_9BACT|nr:hypothetical protein [Oceaniferula marina]NWK55601.1 hypothetical protein [Oceaniferula marina]